MKKIILFLLSIFLMVSVFPENFSLEKKYLPDLYSTLQYFSIEKDQVALIYEVDIPEKLLRYKKVYKDGLLYLEFSENLPKEIDEEYYYDGKDVPLSNDLFILAGKLLDDGEILLFATTRAFSERYTFICPPHRFTEMSSRVYKDCSSFLKEGGKEYSIDNLDNYNVDTPWVEGKKGSGIGEGFTIVNDRNTTYKYLLIMNGYISYNKPYLYKQNNRIKKIKVTGLKSGKSKILEVLDTPHPQTVDISFLTDAEDIRVEIADVYKGTKYDDTCLHYCINFDEPVIPYEDSIGD